MSSVPVPTFDEFYVAYHKKHPDVSVHDVQGKYEVAMYCMFGTKTPHESPLLQSMYTSSSRPVERAAEIVNTKITRRLRKLTALVRDPVRTRSGTRNNRWSTVVPTPTTAAMSLSSPRGFVLPPSLLPKKSDGLERGNLFYPEVDERRHETIVLNTIFGCNVLFPWMIDLLRKFPAPTNSTLPVYMQRANGSYSFGVCGMGTDFIDLTVRILLESPYFRYLYPKDISLYLFQSSTQEEYIILYRDWYREKVHEGTSETDEVVLQKAKKYLEDQISEKMLDFINFVVDDSSKVAMTGWGSTNLEHERLMVKDPSRRRILLVDPHGTPVFTQDEVDLLENLNGLLRTTLPDNHYQLVEFLQEHTRDQHRGEDSCAAVSLLRALYMLFETNTLSDADAARVTPEEREPIFYIDFRIPCVFAVFVSHILQRIGVITPETHGETRGKVFLHEHRMNKKMYKAQQLELLRRNTSSDRESIVSRMNSLVQRMLASTFKPPALPAFASPPSAGAGGAM